MAKLKIVYPICCGADVHRDFLVACIASTDAAGITTYNSKRFSTYSGDLRRLGSWLSDHNCHDICMESTGKYWCPVHNILEPLGFNIVISHPKFVKAIKGKKTDKKDAMWIADLFKHDLVRGSFIPPPDIRQLRDLCRYWVKLSAYVTGEKNRAQNCLTVSNFKLDDVFSNVFGKSATALTDQLLMHSGESFDVAPFVNKRCKTPVDVIQTAVDGAFSPEQAAKLQIIRRHMSNLDELKASLEQLISKLAETYKSQIALLLTVPGIHEPMTAIRIIAEIGADMSVFESAKHLCSWAGLAPQNNESAGKKKTTCISKAGAYINLCLFKSHSLQAEQNPPRRLQANTSHLKSVAEVKRHALLLLAVFLRPFTICFQRTKLTMQLCTKNPKKCRNNAWSLPNKPLPSCALRGLLLRRNASAEIMGHDVEVMRKIYTHIQKSRREQTVAKVANIYKNKKIASKKAK